MRPHTYSGVMAAWLIAVLERLSPFARRVVVAVVALLVLAIALTTLTLEARPGSHARRPAAAPRVPAKSPPERRLPPTVRGPVSSIGLRRAAGAADRFLRSYLRFAYGRASAGSVRAVAPALRGQLIRERAQVTPAQRVRHPRVVSLGVVGTTPGFVVATATVDDGGVAAYRLRFSLRERAGRWLVSNVEDG